MKSTLIVPASVPPSQKNRYCDNYHAITKQTGRLMLFACDQKIEHLHQDFYGPGIDPAAANPKHIFRIASHETVGAVAMQLGLIARYAQTYSVHNYVAKLNSKTNLIPQEIEDPISALLWDVEDVVKLINYSIPIRAVAYTLYLGSIYEPSMLEEAAYVITEAHQHGLVALLWIYLRGRAITDDRDPLLIAGAAGVATSLGADFVKIKAPHATDSRTAAEWLAVAAEAAGTTKIICAGGKQTDNIKEFLHTIHAQIHIGKAAGCAIGRNIFQRSEKNALALTRALSAVVYDNRSAYDAYELYQESDE